MAYIDEHNLCGLVVGDRVRITRKAYEGERGWGCNWAEEMDDAVGEIVTITHVHMKWGFHTDSKTNLDYVWHKGWVFPWFILEKVSDTPAEEELEEYF